MDFFLHTFQHLAKFIQEGDAALWPILIAFIIGLTLALEKMIKLFWYDIDAATLMNEIQKNVLSGDTHQAIKICSNSKALLPRVLKNGLKVANHDIEVVQTAIEATSLEVHPKIYSRFPYLSLVANISTLLGLLGTITGLIESFSAISMADPDKKSMLLAKGIGLAMNATVVGLISAITMMIFHSFLISKADKIYGHIEEYSLKLIHLLGSVHGNSEIKNKNQPPANPTNPTNQTTEIERT